MVASLKLELLEAANPKTAAIEMVKEAVRQIVKIQPATGEYDIEDTHLLGEATGHLFAGLSQLHVVDAAPLVKDFVENTPLTDLRNAVLLCLKNRIDLPERTVNDVVIDNLALASLYEDIDPKVAVALNAEAYLYLGRNQNNKMTSIIDTLEHVQIHYADPEDVCEDMFALTIPQMQDIDAIITAKAKEFLQLPDHKKNSDLADRLSYLLENHEDSETVAPLIQQLRTFAEDCRGTTCQAQQRPLFEAEIA